MSVDITYISGGNANTASAATLALSYTPTVTGPTIQVAVTSCKTLSGTSAEFNVPSSTGFVVGANLVVQNLSDSLNLQYIGNWTVVSTGTGTVTVTGSGFSANSGTADNGTATQIASVLIVFIATGGSVTAMTVQDNNGNYLSRGPTLSTTVDPATPGASGNFYAFVGFAYSGATTYTANWTTNEVASMTILEYQGVESVYWLDATAGYIASDVSTSTTATMTLTTLDSNDWIVAGFANNTTQAYTAIAASNMREPASGTAAARTAWCVACDSGVIAAASSATTVKATQAATAPYAYYGFQLRPFSGAAAATGYAVQFPAAFGVSASFLTHGNGGINEILPSLSFNPADNPQQSGVGTAYSYRPNTVPTSGALNGGLVMGDVLPPFGQLWPRFS